MSLAGLRLGFVIAREPLVEALFRVKDSFNSYPVDSLTQLLAEIALSDESYYEAMRQRIIATREGFSQGLRDLGWSVLPSKTNFVFARKEGIPGRHIYEVLKGRGILVRHFDVAGIENFVRITIGRDEDMGMLLEEVKRSF